jgi:predicted enzyme related to lactoylglutathione lyase
MSAMTNGIGWFQIGTDDPATAERFYGELFGWRVDGDADTPYRTVTTPAEGSIRGGLFNTGGQMPNHAMFCVVVDDVAKTVQAAQELGGTVAVPVSTTPDGLVFADLLDPSGNRIGVYTPPAGSDT